MDVDVRVEFVGTEGLTKSGLGFWDGERSFIRCAFPTPGDWSWRTTCSDSANEGLHSQSGTVLVKLATGSNSLQVHGDLRVSEDGRLLAHADGTPFLWGSSYMLGAMNPGKSPQQC